MGKSITKRLKTIENKNEKFKECESDLEKGKKKGRSNFRSVWSRWSSFFKRRSQSSSELKSFKMDPAESSHNLPTSGVIVTDSIPHMEKWSHDESFDITSNMLNIPIEPGRQLSKIMLSPTKNGFKAVIAHYDVNAALRRSLTEDFHNVSEEISNRRTLTLVFNMEQRTFGEIGVGKSEVRIEDAQEVVEGAINDSLPASALYVRKDPEEVVESAALLEAQLSDGHIEQWKHSVNHSEEVTSDLLRKYNSCRQIRNSRVAFKTSSEPLWKEKEKMRKEMLVKQNVQEMLNQFIFLDRDDSLMNYSREKENPERSKIVDNSQTFTDSVTNYEDKPENKKSMRELSQISENKVKREESFTFEKFSATVSNSARNVASNLLVNIKPFKQYISNAPKENLSPEDLGGRSIELNVNKSAKKCALSQNKVRGSVAIKKSEEKKAQTERKMENKTVKNIQSVCIRCGVEVRGRYGVKSTNHVQITERVSDNEKKKSDFLNEYDKTKFDQKFQDSSSLGGILTKKKDLPCSLCSVRNAYDMRKIPTQLQRMKDGMDDILTEFEGYNHNLVFRKNLSQFKTKISCPVDFKSSQSSMSLTGVIELEEDKVSQYQKRETEEENQVAKDTPMVTVRFIEFVWNDEKCGEFPRLSKIMQKLELEKIPDLQEAEMYTLENSTLLLTLREDNKIIKIMAQKIEEISLKILSNANKLETYEASVMFYFPAYLQWARISEVGLSRRHSENVLEDLKRNISNYQKTIQFPQVINQLLINKFDDMKKGSIIDSSQSNMSYIWDSPQSVPVEKNMKQQETSCKSGSKDSLSTTTYIKNNFYENVLNLEESHTKQSEDCQFADSKMLVEHSYSSKSMKSEELSEDKDDILVEESEMLFVSAIDHLFLEGDSRQLPADEMKNLKDGMELEMLDGGIVSGIFPYDERSDYNIQSCLMFFVSHVLQKQVCIEILDNVGYNYIIRQELEENVDRSLMSNNYTLLSDRRKYVTDREVESFKKLTYIEKNIMHEVETSETSKKEITTIESSKSGNHFLVTSQKILTTNDTIKTTEVLGGVIRDTSEAKILMRGPETVLNERDLSGDNEDVNGIRFLYYKQSDGCNETNESSTTSNFSYGIDKSRKSSSSEVIVSKSRESQKLRIINVKLREALDGTPRLLQTPPDEGNMNKVRDSLQAIRIEEENMLGDVVNDEIEILSQEQNDSVTKSYSQPEQPSVSQVRQPSITAESGLSLARRNSIKVKLASENIIINGEKSSNLIIPQNLRVPTINMFKKIGKGVISQRVSTKKSAAGRKLLICEDNREKVKREAEHTKKMSVVIMLKKNK